MTAAAPRRAAHDEIVGVREYARRRGLSPSAVSQAIRGGRLSKAIARNAEGRMVGVRLAAADREWKKNTDPSKQRGKHARDKNAPREPRTPSVVEELPPAEPTGGAKQEQLFTAAAATAESAPPPTNGKHEPEADPNLGSLARARAAQIDIQTKSSQLELDRRAGELTRGEQVRAEEFRLGRLTRDRVHLAVDRLAARVAAETDVVRVRALMRREIDEALQLLVRQESERT